MIINTIFSTRLHFFLCFRNRRWVRSTILTKRTKRKKIWRSPSKHRRRTSSFFGFRIRCCTAASRSSVFDGLLRDQRREICRPSAGLTNLRPLLRNFPSGYSRMDLSISPCDSPGRFSVRFNLLLYGRDDCMLFYVFSFGAIETSNLTVRLMIVLWQ